MQFRALGPLEIESDDGPVVVSGQRPRALLTALLLRPNTLVSTERLVDALWGEDLVGAENPVTSCGLQVVGAENSVMSCGLQILVYQATEAVSS